MKFVIKKHVDQAAPAVLEAGARAYAAIDPGVDGPGGAIFAPGPPGARPAASGSVSAGGEGSWDERAIKTVVLLRRAIEDSWAGVVQAAYIEEPQFFEGGRGIVTARGGSLVKLCLLAGMIAGRLSVTMHTVRLVPVRDWKGSCPKDVMEPRILRKLKGWNPVTGTTHELDAVGLGMYVRGAL